jgi:hypothetical protein
METLLVGGTSGGKFPLVMIIQDKEQEQEGKKHGKDYLYDQQHQPRQPRHQENK